MSMINNLFEEVISKADISEVISSYGININRNKAICPFHDDKDPSMSISPEKQIFKCFSCGESGNVISFVKKYESKVIGNVDFTNNDALRKVVEICNLDIDLSLINTNVKKALTPQQEENRRLLEANKKAKQFFSYYLNTAPAKDAKMYLEHRKIDQNIIDLFNIGFAGSEKVFCKDDNEYLLENHDVGLVSEIGNYDYFQNRIMFPIQNPNGDIIGFSGRDVTGESKVKYLNTRDTKIFHKGNILYNMHRAKATAKDKELILVEGYMDVISLHKLGYNNAVASMGTSLTKEQIALIKGLNCRVNLMLDNDRAGKDAIIKNIDLLEAANIDVVVTDLSINFNQKDIDEIVVDATDYTIVKRDLTLSRIKPFEYKLKQYFNDFQTGINVLVIEDAYAAFKNSIKTSTDRFIFIEYIKSISNFSKEDIENIIQPKILSTTDLEKHQQAVFRDHVKLILQKELSRRDNLLLNLYVRTNESIVLDGLVSLFERDASLTTTEGLYIDKALDKHLLDNSIYESFTSLYDFKHQQAINDVLLLNQDNMVNAELTIEQKNKIIEQFNNLSSEARNNVSSASQVFVVSSVEDLVKFLPTKLMNPFVYHEMQRAFMDNKMSVFDYNSLFDVDLIEKGLLSMFDDSFKNAEGKLKTVLIYANKDNQLGIEKILSKDNDIKEVAEDKTKVIDKTQNKELEEKKSNPSYYLPPTKKQLAAAEALQIDTVTLDGMVRGELSIALEKAGAEKSYWDSKVKLDDEGIKKGTDNEKITCFNVSKSLIVKETKDGYYINMPKQDKNKLLYVPKEYALMNKEHTNIRVMLLFEPNIYKLNTETRAINFDRKITKDELAKSFKTFKISNYKNNKMIKVIVNQNDLDVFKKGDKDMVRVNFSYENQRAFFVYPKNYFNFINNTDKAVLNVSENWIIKITLENGKEVDFIGNQLQKAYSGDRNYEIQKQVDAQELERR